MVNRPIAAEITVQTANLAQTGRPVYGIQKRSWFSLAWRIEGESSSLLMWMKTFR